MDIANLLNSPPTPTQTAPPPPPSPSPGPRETTRDQRLQVQTLRDARFTYSQV